MYNLENNVQWTEELKSAFKHNVTRASIIYNETEINEENNLVSLVLEEQRYISNLGFIGSATARKLEINLIDLTESINLENKELTLKIGADYDGSTYYINYGNFIVDKPPENDATSGTIRVVAYDYMVKFDKPYVDRVTYPCTLLTLLQDICSQAGVTLGTTDFANKTFLVTDNQFEGATLRDVLTNIAKCAFSWARIGQDNKLYLDFSLTADNTESITIDDYLVNSFKKANEYYGPVNQVTYADSSFDGQESRVKDQQSIDTHGLKELVIYDNLFAYTPDKRDSLIQAGTGILGLTYMPVTQLDLIGLAYLDSRDIIQIGTLTEETFTTRVFNHIIEYNGALTDSVVTEGTSSNEEAYKNTAANTFQNQQTRFVLNKATKQIQLIVEQTADIGDITASRGSSIGRVEFTKINQSEPIRVEIKPLGENISYLYPRNNLYPADDLYITLRTLRFTNTTTNEKFDYILPDDLLYYDSENFDDFVLDYNAHTVIINKKCQYDANGNVVLLAQPRVDSYTYPKIDLTDGDYKVEILKYDNTPYAAYLFCKLMVQNIYTTQFSTKVETTSKIEVAEQSIYLGVNQKLQDYSTTTEMYSAINARAGQIELEVGRKLDEEDFNGARIILAINDDDTGSVLINGDKIDIEGKAVHFKTNINERKGPYTQTDVTRVRGIIMGQIIPTENDYDKYDIDENRDMDSGDLLRIQKAINENNGYIDGSGTFEINPYTMKKSIAVWNNAQNDYSAILSLYGNYFRKLATREISLDDNNQKTSSLIKPDNFIFENDKGTIFGSLNSELNNIKCHTFSLDYDSESSISMYALANNKSKISLFGTGGGYTEITNDGITTPTVTQTSKESVKKNIKKYEEEALKIVKNSEIYEYNYKYEDDADKKHIGFIIGDVSGNYKTPEEVIAKSKEGIEPYTMQSILWKAVQEQQEEIEELRKKVIELEEK